MPQRVIKDRLQLEMFEDLLRRLKLPITITWTTGAPRSNEQNRLQRLWCKEVAEQMGDRTPEDVRGEMKLRFGVPILREENEKFRLAYDRLVKPLPYPTKLELMMEPFDMSVTRLMTTKQKTEYLDRFCRFWLDQGVELTSPMKG